MSNAAALAIALPGCVLTAVRLAALVLAVFGGHPMWPQLTLNLAEAAAVRDVAEIVRQIEAGENPDRAQEVRAGLLSDDPVTLTPIEAAVESGDQNVIDVLVRAGATLDAHEWNRLRCGTDRSEVAGALDRHRPAGAELHCDGVER